MLNFEKTDYFSDPALLEDPYSYYEHLRAKGNVVPMPEHNVVAVLGYDEVVSVWRDDENFSAVNAVIGPFGSIPFPSDKDDISEEIEQFRSQVPFGGLVATQDPPVHARTRSLMAGVLTPSGCETTRNSCGGSPTGRSIHSLKRAGSRRSASLVSQSRRRRSPNCSACPKRITRRSPI